MGVAPILLQAASEPVYTAIYYSTSKTSEIIGIAEGAPGLFYLNAGAVEVFSLGPGGRATIVAKFSSPPYEVGSIPGVVAANGLLYSSVSQASSGEIFSVGPTADTMTTYPVGNYALTPVAGSLPSGQLFGIAYNYSNGSNNLAIIDTSGGVASFYMFPSTDRYPGVPIYGADGNFYGVAQPNTVGQNAYLYKATPTGTATTVATLPFLMTDFVGQGAVLQGSDGNFYGVQSTGLGCSKGNPHGGVYKLTPDGQYTVLHDFGVCGNGIVNSLLEGSDGKLYGAIEGNSELFSLTKSGEYEALFAPSNGTTQGLCPCRLIQGSDGKIYGSAEGGGPGGFGVVFSLDVGLPPPAPQALKFAPQSGPPGTRVRIWGSNLLGASVEFGSFPGVSVAAAGPSYLWATVPEGATTGPITVTTAGGTVVTRADFTVE
jgi:uncharacterized repeat protein (TIGR03803 family)